MLPFQHAVIPHDPKQIKNLFGRTSKIFSESKNTTVGQVVNFFCEPLTSKPQMVT